uniref:hypothetical protein n=1 Tax=Nocardia abscessus TaxID=120957 RepID=UPI0024547EC1
MRAGDDRDALDRVEVAVVVAGREDHVAETQPRPPGGRGGGSGGAGGGEGTGAGGVRPPPPPPPTTPPGGAGAPRLGFRYVVLAARDNDSYLDTVEGITIITGTHLRQILN